MSRESWKEAEAKAKARLSKVVDKAAFEGRQTVTKRGRKVVVIVEGEEWEGKRRRSGSLSAFFTTSPLHHSSLEIERTKEGLRDAEL